MENTKLTYSINTISLDLLIAYLCECNTNFVPQLDQQVDINMYAKKLKDNSITFEAYSNGKIVGLIAAYFNELTSKVGFITSVSTLRSYQRQGISSQLLKNCLEFGRVHGYNQVNLEVHNESKPAIELYKKYGFTLMEEIDNHKVLMKLLL